MIKENIYSYLDFIEINSILENKKANKTNYLTLFNLTNQKYNIKNKQIINLENPFYNQECILYIVMKNKQHVSLNIIEYNLYNKYLDKDIKKL